LYDRALEVPQSRVFLAFQCLSPGSDESLRKSSLKSVTQTLSPLIYRTASTHRCKTSTFSNSIGNLKGLECLGVERGLATHHRLGIGEVLTIYVRDHIVTNNQPDTVDPVLEYWILLL
jgi:hypothetical protein